MNRVNFLALAVIAVIAFFASSIWYSPLLFGRQFLELSGTTASPQPNALKALCGLLRTFILAYVIARLILRLNVADWKNMTPPKSHVMTKMEELIHHFIVVTEGLDAPPGEIYLAAENPKGELGFYINSHGGGVPYRLKIRAPSFVNLSILPELLPGCMLADVTAVLGSLDFVMGECDR